MPLIHDPEDPKGGPGSAFLSTTLHAKVRKRRKKKTSDKTAETSLQDSLIGEDLLEWTDEQALDEPPPAAESIVVKNKAAKRNDEEPATKRPKKTIAPKKGKPQTTSAKSDTTRKPTFHVTPSSSARKDPPFTFTGNKISSAARSPIVRHAVAVDTRALETEEGMTIFQNVREQVILFLSTLSKRGAPPCILGFAQTQQQQTKKSPRVKCNTRGVMEATAMHLSRNVTTALERGRGGGVDLIAPVPIHPPLNAGNKQNRKAVHVPKRLLAHDSWKLFGDLVEAIAREDQANQSTNSIAAPLDVTILTNDVSFLCDTKQDCHKRGLNRFWERMRPIFECNAIRSIEIVVAETGSVILAGNDETAQDDTENPDTEMPDASLDKSDLPPKQEIAALQCIQSIRTQFTKRAEADYKKSRGSEDPTTAVEITLASISNDRLGYHTLFQQRLSELLAIDRDKGSLAFELPETMDGMQCSLSFEATYKVFPFRADSIAAAGLMADLQRLTKSKFEVLQLVPLSCIDASLIFGVPITICAKLENDLAQYKEMKALVGCLFQYLSEKEVALVLRSSDASATESLGLGEPLYHAHGQIFLLMAEELPCHNLMAPSQTQPNVSQMQGSGTRPSTGMLARFASAEQLVDSGSSKVVGEDGDVESMKELTEYVENSLDFLDSSALNPLLIDATKTSQDESASETMPTEESDSGADTRWTDNDGVGARLRANDSDAEQALDDSSDDDAWNAFVYT